ncbi:MAG TPA: YdeI/OmpD-associated family protein [Planctomycetaceae bacterium]|jgi:uncharacterized protein YdeI (YjbR/CyaY-like superfamily)|nr:YdeI/OmpD-associated family protein [Planctomycetaceae bacterium]
MTVGESELETIECPSAMAWERWLGKNHSRARGVWLRFFKKHSKIASIGHADALNAALCYGWIDGQLKKHDAASWLRKFTPRRSKSIWSKRNQELVERLTQAGKMKPAGLKEVAAAKRDGRWGRAYDSPSKMTVPADFRKALSQSPAAKKFFATLNKANLYAIAWRLQTAKQPATRKKRMNAIIEMLEKGEKFHG